MTEQTGLILKGNIVGFQPNPCMYRRPVRQLNSMNWSRTLRDVERLWWNGCSDRHQRRRCYGALLTNSACGPRNGECTANAVPAGLVGWGGHRSHGRRADRLLNQTNGNRFSSSYKLATIPASRRGAHCDQGSARRVCIYQTINRGRREHLRKNTGRRCASKTGSSQACGFCLSASTQACGPP